MEWLKFLNLIIIDLMKLDLKNLLKKYNTTGGWTMNKLIKRIHLIYRKLRYKFSKKDLNAILKYDPLDVLN